MADDTQNLIDQTKKAAGWLTGTSAVKAVGDVLTSKGETPAPAPADSGGMSHTAEVGKAPPLGQQAMVGGAIGAGEVKNVGEPVKTAPIKQNYSEYQE